MSLLCMRSGITASIRFPPFFSGVSGTADSLPTQVRVFLWLDHQPEKFVVAPGLSDLIGMHTGTRAAIVAAVWEYIHSKKLLHGEERDLIKCDAPLQKLLGDAQFPLAQLPARLERCLLPPRPIELDMDVTLTETDPVALGIFDVDVEVVWCFEHLGLVWNFLLYS